jgi:tripartite-type tricarboxylate transporter receptor subunit TctC
MTYPRSLARATLSALFATAAFGAAAQDADFFKGKTLSVNIGYEAGSTYDLYARLLADHIGRFLPGKPNIIARNMPGAGSLRVASFIYKAAPKDGSVWGAISRDVATEPLLYGTKSKAAFKDPLEFIWIGSLNTEVGVMAVWHTTGIKTWEEARTKPIIAAMSSSQGGISTRAVNSLLHAKFQQVCCYGGGNLQNFAMERGEVEARIGWSWSSLKATKMDWLESGKIRLLMQIGLKKNPDIPGDVPLVLDLAPTEKDKKALQIIFSNQSMGRPYIMPPGVPAARVATVREAFMTMVKDKAFLAAAEKKKLEINDPQPGEAVEDLLREVYASPPDAVAAARHAISSGEIKMVREPKKKKKKKKE